MNIGMIPAKWAATGPQRPALVDVPSGRRMNFGELDERVRRLGNAFVDAGLDKGARVGVLAKNAIEYGGDPKRAALEFRKHLGWYTKGIHGGKKLRMELFQVTSLQEMDVVQSPPQ